MTTYCLSCICLLVIFTVFLNKIDCLLINKFTCPFISIDYISYFQVNFDINLSPYDVVYKISFLLPVCYKGFTNILVLCVSSMLLSNNSSYMSLFVVFIIPA